MEQDEWWRNRAQPSKENDELGAELQQAQSIAAESMQHEDATEALLDLQNHATRSQTLNPEQYVAEQGKQR